MKNLTIKKIDKKRLKRLTIKLESELLKCSLHSRDANRLLLDLKPLILKAKGGEIDFPYEWGNIPGGRAFLEGGLVENSALEEAYAKFKVELSGGMPGSIRKFK